MTEKESDHAGTHAGEAWGDAVARRPWKDAYAALAAADRASPLEPDEVGHFAAVAFLLGREDESASLWARAHDEFLNRGEVIRAARCAFWAGFGLLGKGEGSLGGGWIARARRLVEDDGRDCVERGYVLLPAALERAAQSNFVGARDAFRQAAEIGDRFRDQDLTSLARQGEGRALIRLGETERGLALLDEVMVAVSGREVSPVVVGTIYCSVLSACHEIFDLRRAQEWTMALSAWCESQPDLVPYRGECLVRRAEMLRLHGAWRDALAEAGQARERLSHPRRREGLGGACYQEAELHRLRGEFAQAERAYQSASEAGQAPEPGLALLRLAQGRRAAAAAAIRRMVNETMPRGARSRALAAHVEIMLGTGDLAAARASADELTGMAATLDAPFLRAVAALATGRVLLAEGDPRGALPALRRAAEIWNQLGAPYEAATARVGIGLACRALGDEDAAQLELEAARRVFAELEAAPDLARLATFTPDRAPSAHPAGLTPREVEVLRLVATGKTNRAIARALDISEKTVARHLSNVFTKLGLSSRAAATAFAYEHDLLDRST